MRSLLLFLSLFAVLLVSCAGQASPPAPSGDLPARAAEQYIAALVEKNADRLSALSCAAWETDALMELDSFQAVQTRVEGLQCRTVSTEGDTSVVQCQGKIIATYGNEDQSLDLSVRSYQVVKQGSDYLVCGYR